MINACSHFVVRGQVHDHCSQGLIIMLHSGPCNKVLVTENRTFNVFSLSSYKPLLDCAIFGLFSKGSGRENFTIFNNYFKIVCNSIMHAKSIFKVFIRSKGILCMHKVMLNANYFKIFYSLSNSYML